MRAQIVLPVEPALFHATSQRLQGRNGNSLGGDELRELGVELLEDAALQIDG